MKAELAARNNQPVPTDICHLGPGAWCDESAHAGELSVQGVVEHAGRRDRFDQAVGRGWMLIGLDADPAAALTESQRRQLARLEGRSVRLASSRGLPGDAVDVEGTYAKWLHAIDATYVLMRPDFYVAVTAKDPSTLQSRFDKVMNAIHLQMAGHGEAAVSA